MNTYSIVANTTPEAAYAYVADITTHPVWSPDSMKVESLQPGAPAVGSKYKAEAHLVNKSNLSVVEITAMSPNRSVTFTATDSTSLFQHEFVFTRQNGATRIDRNVTPMKTTLFFKIISPVLEPLVVRPGSMKCLGLLKDRLEQAKS